MSLSQAILVFVVLAPGVVFGSLALLWLLGWVPSERVVSRITGLTFSCTPATKTSCSEIDMTLRGQLTSGDTFTKSIIRTVVQPIFVRSGAT